MPAGDAKDDAAAREYTDVLVGYSKAVKTSAGRSRIIRKEL